MKWRKTPEAVTALLSDAVKDVRCVKKPMFGYAAYFINDNMFIGTHQENIVARLSEKDRKKLIGGSEGVVPFEPMPGRVMKEYVVVPESVYSDKEKFAGIVKMAVAYVSSLPPKEKKRRVSPSP